MADCDIDRSARQKPRKLGGRPFAQFDAQVICPRSEQLDEARCTHFAEQRRDIDTQDTLTVCWAIKGGGHNVAGNAVCDDGIMFDLSSMTAVDVDSTARTARVQPGALLSDLDQACQARGLVTPAGFISSTGVAGLTLGGGFGYLSRRFGLSVDNVRSFDLVTSTGQQLRASRTENVELF